jgi:hypothetical protein
MNDFAFVGIIVALFALAVLFVRGCDRVIGRDDAAAEPTVDMVAEREAA